MGALEKINRPLSKSEIAVVIQDGLMQQREEFIKAESARIINDTELISDMLIDLLDNEHTAPLVGFALRDAIQEVDKSFDGIGALADLLISASKNRARKEWSARMDREAPQCAYCQFADKKEDPFGTGDSPMVFECQVPECPWGK